MSTLRERAEAQLVMCASCDVGLPHSCTCPREDPRTVIQELLAALDNATAGASAEYDRGYYHGLKNGKP